MDDYRQRESLSFEKVSRKKKRSRYLTFGFENPLIVAVFIGLILFFVMLCVGSNIDTESGQISRSDIGTIATHDYKATRDFTFDRVDQEATDRVREQRVAEVLPIFRWDRTYRESVLGRLHLVFLNMRNGLEEESQRLHAMRVECEEPGRLVQKDESHQRWAEALLSSYADSELFKPYLSMCALSADEVEAGLKQWSDLHRDSFVQSMGYVVDDSTFLYMTSQKFSENMESGLRGIFDVVLDRMIVSARQSIDGVEDLSVQWQDGNERRQKTVDKSEKTMISTLESSEMMFLGLMREQFSQAPEGFFQYFKQFVRPNMTYDEAGTERERQFVRDKTAELRVIEEYKKGQTIVARGNPIKLSHYEIFEKMSQSQGDLENRTVHWIALVIVIGVLLFMLWRSFWGMGAQRQKSRDLVYFSCGVLVYALSLRGFVLLNDILDSVYHWSYSILLLFPFAAGPMLARVVVNRFYSYLFGVVELVLTSLIIDDQSILLGYVIVIAMAGCLLTERPKRSNVVFRYGLILGVLGALIGVSVYLLRGTNMTHLDYWVVAFLGLGGGLLSAGVVTIGLPIAESLFGYVTSNKLLELSNLEHPALKALFMEAPGTYQHSIMVGTLNEAAADAIGANSILARVGGYYHDIGKVKNAQYFAENQRGDNPHNRLNPNMSALILKTHERDGLEIAKKYKLPQDIRDFIATHHGTSRIGYFYQRAKEQQERVHEEDYRYPGPRPQTRETGICMVSDMVEAAVRSLPDKNPDKILVLVHKLINHKFTDGQFDECDLTLRDLNDIANALIGILNAFYHHRPEYPDQKKERERNEAEKKSQAQVEPIKEIKSDVEKPESGEKAKSEEEKLKSSEAPKVSDKFKIGDSANVVENAKSVGKDKAVEESKRLDNKASDSEKSGESKKAERVKRASLKDGESQGVLNASLIGGAAAVGEMSKVFESKSMENSNCEDDEENSLGSDKHRILSNKDSVKKNADSLKGEDAESVKSERDGSAPEEKAVSTEEDASNLDEQEADSLLKEAQDDQEEDGGQTLSNEGEACEADKTPSSEGIKPSVYENMQSIQDAYDLTFSSKVDVFKRS